jgi:hypothetical protein
MQRRRFQCFDRSHRATPRYQRQARYDSSKKSHEKQASICGFNFAGAAHDPVSRKFFVSFVSFVVNFTGFESCLTNAKL